MFEDIKEARLFLTAACVFFDDEGDPKWDQTLNLNDAFYWGCSDCEYVEDEELPRVATLFWHYGWPGILYWVAAEKRPGEEVPGHLDVRRQLEYVFNEEQIRKKLPSSSDRCFTGFQYTIGEGEAL